MNYTDNARLRVAINPKECDIPRDERERMERTLAPLYEAVRDLPASDLALNVIHHPQKNAYHVEARLKIPGRSLARDAEDTYLDSAFQRCIAALVADVQANSSAAPANGRRTLDQDIVMPQDPDAGPLARAVAAGDYRTFRTGLAGYEEWLRGRVGRWIQRYPEAQERLRRRGRLVGDVLEEVYLHAFEKFAARPTDLRLSDWLDKLIDPALKEVLRHPDRAEEEASMARTVRQAGV